jgi:hypothetical protein
MALGMDGLAALEAFTRILMGPTGWPFHGIFSRHTP